MRVTAAVLSLATMSATAHAQTKCDDDGSCEYNFSVPQEGYWPDWAEVSPVEINYVNVVKGKGLINVESDGPTFFQLNHAHLIWGSVGIRRNVTASVRFTGDNGRSGWIQKLTDGSGSADENCRPWEHTTRASDETLILTLYDDGRSFIGAFLGDLLPLGENIVPTGKQPPTGFGVLGIAQLVVGELSPRILGYQVIDQIKVGGKAVDLSLAVSDHSVTATMTDKKNVYEVSAEALDYNIRGGVGIVGVTGARPYCIYQPGGEFNRQFEIDSVAVN